MKKIKLSDFFTKPGITCPGIFKRDALPVWTLLLKILLFNAVWCSYTTFQPFSRIILYETSTITALLLGLPYVLSRRRWVGITMMALTDMWLIANLMYFRTYYAHIPLSSYGLVGNLADFGGSVLDSFRWIDLAFPLTTLLSAVLLYKAKQKQGGV